MGRLTAFLRKSREPGGGATDGAGGSVCCRVVSRQQPCLSHGCVSVDARREANPDLRRCSLKDRLRSRSIGVLRVGPLEERGGIGTWGLASTDAYAKRFAAIAPVCGGFVHSNRRKRAAILADTPVWAFQCVSCRGPPRAKTSPVELTERHSLAWLLAARTTQYCPSAFPTSRSPHSRPRSAQRTPASVAALPPCHLARVRRQSC